MDPSDRSGPESRGSSRGVAPLDVMSVITDGDAVATAAGRPRGRRLRRWRALLPVAVSILAGVAVWQAIVMSFQIPSYVLPRPSDVWSALVAGLSESPVNRGSFWYHLGSTLYATLLGFAAGSALGLALAALMAEFRLVERLLLPYVVGFQSLPKVAIAPLYIIWFGYQIESKVAMAATLTLFPVLINALQGLVMTEKERLELLASLKATRWQTFRYIKFPSALPLIFAGLNLAVVYALLGSIVAEFIGSQRGMGVIITQLQTVSDTAGVFAVLVVLAVVGYALITIMRLLQRRLVFWTNGGTQGAAP